MDIVDDYELGKIVENRREKLTEAIKINVDGI
jgi:hypothetical protein